MTNTSQFPRIVEALIQAGHHAPSADNSQPWRFDWDGKCLTLRYDTQRVSGKTFGPEEHATLLAMGAVRENILQIGAFLGANIELISPEHNDGSYLQIGVNSPTGDFTEAQQHPLFKRHTNRLPYLAGPIAPEIIKCLCSMSEKECRVVVFDSDESVNTVAEWIRIASEVRFQTRDLHEFLTASLRFTPEEASQGDGLDLRTFGLPFGGKQLLHFVKDWNRLAFLNQFGLYKMLARVEARRVSTTEAVLGILGPAGRDNTLDAGALMERVWIYLNSCNIAVHPYYVVSDQLQRLSKGDVPIRHKPSVTALKSRTETVLKSKDPIHIFFRLGYPMKAPVRSCRLSLDKVTEIANRRSF